MDSFGCTLTLWVHTGEAEAWSEDAWETELPALQATTSWALNSTHSAHKVHNAQCALTKGTMQDALLNASNHLVSSKLHHAPCLAHSTQCTKHCTTYIANCIIHSQYSLTVDKALINKFQLQAMKQNVFDATSQCVQDYTRCSSPLNYSAWLHRLVDSLQNE